MKRLLIWTFLLLLPVAVGGCKVCYSWQLGRDQGCSQPVAPACAPCEMPCGSCPSCGCN
jgi:hypothetical protein